MGKKRAVTAQIKVQVTGGQATPAPPVGTALGPHDGDHDSVCDHRV